MSMGKTYSKELAELVNQYLVDEDLHFSFDDQAGIFRFKMVIKGKIKMVDYIIQVKDDELFVYGISPIGPDTDDEEMMASMAEFICRVNYGLRNGNFEMDMQDGEIRYKSFIDCDHSRPSVNVFRDSLGCVSAMFRRYADGIVNIIFTASSAEDAIEECKKKSPMEELRRLLGAEGSSEDLEELLSELSDGDEDSDEDADESEPGPVANDVAEDSEDDEDAI